MSAPRTRLQGFASFVTRWLDPLVRPFAGVLPTFCVLTHVGRRSGTVHRTPLNVFRRGDRVVFALTYGSSAEWVRNVLAAGECEIRTMGRDLHLVEPRIVVDPGLAELPWLPRVIERANHVTEMLAMRVGGPGSRVAADDGSGDPVPDVRPQVGQPVVERPATRVGDAERDRERSAADHGTSGEGDGASHG